MHTVVNKTCFSRRIASKVSFSWCYTQPYHVYKTQPHKNLIFLLFLKVTLMVNIFRVDKYSRGWIFTTGYFRDLPKNSEIRKNVQRAKKTRCTVYCLYVFCLSNWLRLRHSFDFFWMKVDIFHFEICIEVWTEKERH